MVNRRFSIRFCSLLACAAVSCVPCSAFGHADIEEQIVAVTERIQKEPRNPDLYLKRGELHRIHMNWREADADYDRAAKLDPKLATVELARGNMFFDSGRIDQAKAAFDRFLEKFPDHANARILRAQTLVKLGKPKEAVEDYTRAIDALATPAPEFYIERAQASAAQGTNHLDEALRGLDAGRTKLGFVITLELTALDLELKKRNFDAALSRLERMAAYSPRKETWLARRGDILEQAGRMDDARKAFADSLAAIESLPPRLRKTKAVEDLELRVRQKLQSTCAQSAKGAAHAK